MLRRYLRRLGALMASDDSNSRSVPDDASMSENDQGAENAEDRRLDFPATLAMVVLEPAVTMDDDADDSDSSNSSGSSEEGGESEGEDILVADGTQLQASSHSYLGEVDDVNHRSGILLLPPGTSVELPLFHLDGIVLFPGDTLPLRVIQPRQRAAVECAMESSRTLAVVLLERQGWDATSVASVGTTAEIRRLRRCPDGALNVLCTGRQRFDVERVWSTADTGMRMARVGVREDPPVRSWPRAAFASMVVVPARGHGPQHAPTRWSRLAPLSPWPAWVYCSVDAFVLARRALAMLQARRDSAVPTPPALLEDPQAASYWLARNLPLADSTRLELLAAASVVDRLRRVIELLDGMAVLRCRTCRARVADAKDVFSLSMDGPVAAYVNTNGFVHEAVTVRHVSGLQLEGDPQTEHSWFPGYAWTIAYCGRCGEHMGWRFTRVRNSSTSKRASFSGGGGSQRAAMEVDGARPEGTAQGAEGPHAAAATSSTWSRPHTFWGLRRPAIIQSS
eukprot:jgi/Mesvir1/19391/Mv10426-RA.1